MNLYDFLKRAYEHPVGYTTNTTSPIRIDDQSKTDVYRSFCCISVTVPERDKDIFVLNLSNVPWNEHVEALVTELNGVWSQLSSGRCFRLEMSVKKISKIRKLAEAIRKVSGRGRRYIDCNWKWMCPRTAASLNQFADQLKEYYGSGRANA